MADWSLTSFLLKLIKIGTSVVRHTRAITFQLAEFAVTGPMVRATLPRPVAFEHHRRARDRDPDPNRTNSARQVCQLR